MTILDANILIYGYNADAPEHPTIRGWLEQLLASGERAGVPWLALWAFVRVATNPRLSRTPKPAVEVFGIVRTLLDEPQVKIIEPGPRHIEILEQIVIDQRIFGPLFTDATLAAMAIEYGATLASTDRDFSRFRDLRWINPMDAG